ncbi:MAG TPA: acyl carrier protein [Archangium sp.]|jgi:acyl carrier protein|uniref:acyl carrier protein n=1 Tax=Archangium sp. TaxID=1872627 RepID=UPI002ED8FEEB
MIAIAPGVVQQDVAAAEVRAALRRFVIQNFYIANPATLSDEVSLLESGIIDSTGVLELVGFLEHDLGLTVADAELVPENLDTLSRIAAFVDRKRRG